MTRPLTRPRRHALEVLVAGETTGRTVRESNQTSSLTEAETVWCTHKGCGEPLWWRDADRRWVHEFVSDTHDPKPPPLTIYWQSRDWLEVRRYITSRVTVTADASGRLCRLTKAGRELAKEAGIS